MKSTQVGPVLGRLPRGCDLCGRGAKLVLFATGKCPFSCFYCPISRERRGSPGAFANERPLVGLGAKAGLIKEAENMEALGAGVTGGDPLTSDRTFQLIRILKENFSPDFHIHLYTRTNDPARLKLAYDAGVDEIRFHWSDPSPALDFSWDVGVEVPAIPGDQARLRAYLTKANQLGLKFANLNELEFSDSNFENLKAKDITHRGGDPADAGAEGSEKLAMQTLHWAQDQGFGMSLHYCSAQTKLVAQLTERYKRAARRITLPYQQVTPDGTVLTGRFKDTPQNRVLLAQAKADFHAREGCLYTSPRTAEKLGGTTVEFWPTFDHRVVEVTPHQSPQTKGAQ